MRRLLSISLFLTLALLSFAESRTVIPFPVSQLGKDVLFGSRIVSVNKASGKVYADGMMKEQPVLVRFTQQNDSCVFMKQVGYSTPNGCSWKTRMSKEPPASFRIVRSTEDAVVLDVTDYFSSYPELVSAIPPKELGRPAVSHRIDQIENNKDYLRIVASYSYETGLNVCAACFLMYLNESPMPSRTAIGSNGVEYRGADGKRMKISYRWNVRQGSRIDFYVDRKFPEEWFPFIKEGIEDWNKAFDAIGIHNLLSVQPEPESFDSSSPMVNMVRYIDVDEANAKGQVYVDPRSGEILQADILWWKDVIGLMKGWRYVQTGAADPRARLADYPIEILGPMIRHAVCHEAGHVLGLNHNMGASYAYPSDSLKSVSFTEKYGTSASVMDYARYNHIADTDDVRAGVNLLPPRVGPYDMYAIASIYAETPAEPGKYCFYSPFISAAISPDPSSQAETLGDDLLASSAAGIANCSALLELDGLSEERLKLLKKQYYRYVFLTLSNIGGAVHGTPVPEKIQAKTLKFIFESLQDTPAELSDEAEKKAILKELTGNFLPERIKKTKGEKALKRYIGKVERYHRKYNI